jgi:hypothetical protein
MSTRRHLLSAASSAWALGTAASLRAQEAPTLRMPGPPFRLGQLPYFQGDLAALALQKAGIASPLQILSTQTWPRQVRELRDGHADLAPLPALDPRLYAEFHVQRVDFPIRRGLLGVRQLVVRSDRVAEFAQLPNLSTLQRRYRMGYGTEWGDLHVMRQLGFQVVTERTTDLLYDDLNSGRVDFLSRGLNEAPSEVAHFSALTSNPNPAFAVVPGVLLFYPLDDCFFVSRHQPRLAAALLRGLRLALSDGSYRQLFHQHFGESLAAVRDARVWRLEAYPRPSGLPLSDYDVLQRWVPKRAAARPTLQA